MARRSAPSSAAASSYIPIQQQPRKAIHDPNESAFASFLRTEIYAPEKIQGNISIATGISLFAVGILAARTWGELIIPA